MAIEMQLTSSEIILRINIVVFELYNGFLLICNAQLFV